MSEGGLDLPVKGQQVRVDGSLVTVRDADWVDDETVELFAIDSRGNPARYVLSRARLAAGLVKSNDRGGDANRALTALWGRWMQHAVPRIRSAVLATRPLRPYAHQDDAVHGHMLNQPRLRFLLGDEPGTGKTIMAGMYLTEGRRQGLIQGRAVIVVPAHLTTKWERDLRRLFGVKARRISSDVAVDPTDLDPRFDTWIVSVDLFTHNPDVRRKVAGPRASWSIVIFDEAHRLTPTSQFLGAARQVAERSHHLLLLTATPHRGKEHFFRGLMNLLDPTLYPWDPRQSEYESALVPSKLSFLRRMKEDLVDHEGAKLFPPRYAETLSVDLRGSESAAYDAVMQYVETYYADTATLARSIYGKRAASSLQAAHATLERRAAALRAPVAQRRNVFVPDDLLASGRLGGAADDDQAWADAEEAIIHTRTRDKKGELHAIAALLSLIEGAIQDGAPAKWQRVSSVFETHDLRPGAGQLLVFSEFTDTARWLCQQFEQDGFSCELLEGGLDNRARDTMQERFLAGEFQVLVSTDAGGEGIDLQSANVMINWDLPWSMVRLEQRMGRLHRIGQTKPVFVYHLVAPHTREGRVQEVMLNNLQAAAEALDGKLYDLLDASASQSGFDWGTAMLDAHAGRTPQIPPAAAIIEAARGLIAEERSLSTPTNVADALERFASDRLEAINPVIVDAFLDQMKLSCGWEEAPGPAAGIRYLSSSAGLPEALGGERAVYIAADGSSVRQAINDGATDLGEVIVLGPTEEPFHHLVEHALKIGEEDLVRGASLVDTGSLTSYLLLLFDADLQLHDGTSRTTRKAPVLIRCSAGQAVSVAWESLMSLCAQTFNATSTATGGGLTPGLRHEATVAARASLSEQVESLVRERYAWIEIARVQLDATQYRFEESIADRPLDERANLLQHFGESKQQRIAVLEDIREVKASGVRLVGWVAVQGGARAETMGYDPDSEKVAVAAVVRELERMDYVVDDRQTARLGYDLYARHRSTREQRLIEVKGLREGLQSIWLEQNEWAQAQQRGDEYWLYVVDSCEHQPFIRLRQQNPAQALSGPRSIQRFQVTVSQMKRLMAEQ